MLVNINRRMPAPRATGAMADAALRCLDERDVFVNHGIASACFEKRHRLLRRAVGSIEHLEHPARGLNGFARGAGAAQPDQIDARGNIDRCADEPWRQGIGHAGATADKRPASRARKLMHGGKPTDDHFVSNFNMPAEHRTRTNDAIVGNHAIVPQVSVGHPIVAITDARGVRGLAAMHRGAFAECVAATDDAPRAALRRVKANILRRKAKAHARVQDVSVAEFNRAIHDGIGDQSAVCADLDRANRTEDETSGADGGASPDLHITLNDRGAVDDGVGVDAGTGLCCGLRAHHAGSVGAGRGG